VQKEGIAQGSVLSTFLCNIYYGDIERKMLRGVFTPEGKDGELSMLVRIVDDFLLISTSKEVANGFLRKMTKGVAELGVVINKAKTVVSFDTKEGGTCVEGEDFPWCGMMFDVESCEARIGEANVLIVVCLICLICSSFVPLFCYFVILLRRLSSAS